MNIVIVYLIVEDYIMNINKIILARFQHEQLLQEYRHTREAHIFVTIWSAPIHATKCGINIVWFNVLDFHSKTGVQISQCALILQI